nr:hypothetical protein [Tanacetum cinerariifolium]
MAGIGLAGNIVLCTMFQNVTGIKFPVIHPPPQETSIKILRDQENVINSVQTFLRKFNRISFFETPKVLLLAWDRVFKIKDALGNKQYKPEDIQELLRELFNDVQNIHEELADNDLDSEGDTLSLERLLHDDLIPLLDTLDFSIDVRVFLPFFTYPVTSSILLSSRSEDTIFDLDIYHFSSLELGVSHWSGTFMKFNIYPNHLNESPMEMLFSTCFPMDR